jgi:RimJ/RimL family protein N-acetyltransferase
MDSGRLLLELRRRLTAISSGCAVKRISGIGSLPKTLRLPESLNISEIVRGVFCSGYLGYYALVPHSGKGYMTRGLAAVLYDAFRVHRLHRLEANIQPGNQASRALVQRLGFRLEGLSPRYLKIGRRWCDHERWAITLEDWKEINRTIP